jgi:hypothetical protein
MAGTSVPDYSGRETFEFILNQIEDCLKDIKPFFDLVEAKQIYNKRYLAEMKVVLQERPGVDLILCNCIFWIEPER